jgi:hypothetical protein
MALQVWLVQTVHDVPRTFLVDYTGQENGFQDCGCCYVADNRQDAKEHELILLRGWQANIQAELADCENRIVAVMRELGVVNNSDNRRV